MKRQILKNGNNLRHLSSLILVIGLLLAVVLGCNLSNWDAESACNYLSESGLPPKKYLNISEAQICQAVGKLDDGGRVAADPNLTANPNVKWVLMDMKDSQEKIIFYRTVGDKLKASEIQLQLIYPKNADSKAAKETFVRLSDEILQKTFKSPLPEDIKGRILSDKDIVHDTKINGKIVRFHSGNSGGDVIERTKDCRPGKPCVIHDELSTHKVYELKILL